MQQHLLLTGAGFTRNWGGWLANEAFEYLLGSSRIDDSLRELLWNDRNKGRGFEDSLAALQEQYELQERSEKSWSPQVEQNLQNLTQALYRMFGDMTLGFSAQSFEFTTIRRFT